MPVSADHFTEVGYENNSSIVGIFLFLEIVPKRQLI